MALSHRESWSLNDDTNHLSLFMAQLLKFLQAGGGAAIGYSQEQRAIEINFVLGEKFQNVTVTLSVVLSNYQSIIQAAFIALCRLNGEIPETKSEYKRSTEDDAYYSAFKQASYGKWHIPGSWNGK